MSWWHWRPEWWNEKDRLKQELKDVRGSVVHQQQRAERECRRADKAERMLAAAQRDAQTSQDEKAETQRYMATHRHAAQQTCVGNMKQYPAGSLLVIKLAEPPDTYMMELLNDCAAETGSILLVTHPGNSMIDVSEVPDRELERIGLKRA